MVSRLKLVLTAGLLAIVASSAQATTVNFTFKDGAAIEASGSFSYGAIGGVLHYADLSAFSINVEGALYNLAFANASSNYSYFAYNTASNSFVAGTGTGTEGGPFDELLGAFANDLTSGFFFKPDPVNQFTEITTEHFDDPFTTITLTVVPEPLTLTLLAAPLVWLGLWRRRKVVA
jgi:hypothetical protein